jgi:hypothetical protein
MSDAAPTTANPAEGPPEPPKNRLEKLGAALPIGLTALATVFAGMSTGALQQAMYWKSQAAQDQAKATNQWTLAGFKRDRALVMQAAAAQLRAASGYAPASFAKEYVPGAPDAEKKDRDRDEIQARAIGWLTEPKGERAGPPPVRLPEVTDPNIVALRDAIEKREPEAELVRLAGKIKHDAINRAIDEAEKAAEQVDRDWDPVVKAASDLVRSQAAIKPGDPDAAKKAPAATAAQAAGFEMEERRYRAESRLNQGIGFLYEIRVKSSSAESDKHRRKSETLFVAMLVAQIGGVTSSLALARKHKSALWLFAGVVGLAALGVGAYGLLSTLLQ